MALKRKSDELDSPNIKLEATAPTDKLDGKIYHHVENETMPNSVVLDPNFIKLSAKVDEICHSFLKALKDSSCDNTNIKQLVEEVASQILNRKVDSTVMSLNGPMGSGKSETINTILHESIALTGKTGSSVTLVPHRYAGPFPTQKKRFLARILFFCKKDIFKFFEAEIAAYFRSKNASDSENGGVQDREDIDACDTVVDALYFLFMDHDECKTRSATKDLLHSAESESDQRLIRRLSGWAESAIQKHATTKDCVVIEADTAETLLAKLDAYTSESTEDDGIPVPSLWPLVRGVIIHFENPISRMGISLLDVPGSSDNHIRRAMAQRFAREASHAAIIANASRANSGNTISKEAKVFKGKGDGRLMAIITCSDEIDTETMVGGTAMERQEVKSLRRKIVDLEKQLNATRLEQNNATNMEDEFRLWRQCATQEQQIRMVRNQETALRIAMRGKNTRETIQRKLSEVTNFVNPVPVFWLSNLPYRQHRAGYIPQSPPLLTAEQTNGPAIRRMIAEFPNVASLKQLEHIYSSQLPMLFSRVHLFSTRAPADLKADLEVFVDSPLQRFPGIVNASLLKIKQGINDKVLDPLKQEEEHWLSKAEAKCNEWADEFASSSEMLYLMARDGRRRKRPKKRAVNLSNELQGISSGQLDAGFASVVPVTRDSETYLMYDIDYLCDGIIDGIKGDPSGQLVMLDAFYEVVHCERRRLCHDIADWMQQYVNDLDVIKSKMTLDDEDAYMTQAMLPIYAKVRVIKGGKGLKPPPGGFPKQRHQVFKAEVIKQGHLWTTICASAAHDVDEVHERHSARLKDLVRSAFENIRSSFDAIETTDSEDPREQHQKTLLTNCLQDSERCMKGEMKDCYNALKAAFPAP